MPDYMTVFKNKPYLINFHTYLLIFIILDDKSMNFSKMPTIYFRF